MDPSAGPVPAVARTFPRIAVPAGNALVRHSLRKLLAAWVRLTVHGAHHVPAEGPALIASTHLSHADSVALAVAIRRPIHFVGDVALTRWPVIGPMLPGLGMVPLRRGEGDGPAMEALSGLLADGGCIAVYPEGSRSRDGRVHRLRSGTARLAAAHQVPVVPASVEGIDSVWPIDRRPRLLGGRVTVRFGPPLPPPEEPSPRARRAFNERLQAALAELAGVEMADDFSPPHGGEEAPR